jgi:hypothetical protein
MLVYVIIPIITTLRQKYAKRRVDVLEIAERIVKGNKAYYANAKLIKSIFLK